MDYDEPSDWDYRHKSYYGCHGHNESEHVWFEKNTQPQPLPLYPPPLLGQPNGAKARKKAKMLQMRIKAVDS